MPYYMNTQIYILHLKLTNIMMISVQSPQFSSSSKIDLAAKMSPCFRNKRVPSAQDNYMTHWNRANSCKRLDSPSKISQKNRKRSHNSQQRMKNKSNISHNIVQQLGTLKNQYTSLKVAYQDLIQNKVKNDEESNKLKQQAKKNKEQNEKLLKQNERLRSKVQFLEMEIERIRRQSLKLIQIEQFKTHKLQENLIQKQKAISSLIESFKIDAKVEVTALNTYDTEQPNLNKTSQAFNQANNSAHLQSLTLSKDKTLTNSQFISISLTSMMESESQYRQELSTKRLHNSSYNDQEKVKATENIVEKPLNDRTNKENEVKGDENFKKLRKQITKKIEVNIDERAKEEKPKHPLDRKNSKSNKASKARIRDQSLENRSSKKKITCK